MVSPVPEVPRNDNNLAIFIKAAPERVKPDTNILPQLAEFLASFSVFDSILKELQGMKVDMRFCCLHGVS